MRVEGETFWCSACNNTDPHCGACFGQGYEERQRVEKTKEDEDAEETDDQ
jgi:hypothetical protein